MSNDIVHAVDGELRVSSETIAERTEIQHASVLRIVRDNQAEFEVFGHLGFEIRDAYQGHKATVAHLNEQQATLLMTFMRNSPVVKAFKIELVRQFFEMRQALNATPALPDFTTPEGALRMFQLAAKQAEELVAAKAEVAELAPLATLAKTHVKGKGDIARQAFARDVVKWAIGEGVTVKVPEVFEFLGRQLDLFVVGNRSDNGNATVSGERRGLSTTEKGVSKLNGYAFETGKLTAKGVEYAWARIQKYIEEHGTLVLPKKEKVA
ncbi:hypothetical protein GCM10010910_00930 [Microbacterium nanhaiense]|uniref:Phage regulatory protein Rha (Phage_pRha) n=2 Tax=Microbacterium nanhaiense TaxID=1301026 RepID=A0ABQ2MWW1_9MICO|nr:hypothetical protein GCM10010910_00930 [Microbacterium nanhaiense]